MEPDDALTRTAVVEYERQVTLRRDLLEAAFHGLGLPEKTPDRVARWLEAACFEVVGDPMEILSPVFQEAYDEIVFVKDIRVNALCEHHLLPFTGKAAVAYLPRDGVVGISKLARLVQWACTRPTLQERITKRIIDAMESVLAPRGVAVLLYNINHTCMTTRGVDEHEATTTTSSVTGVFKDSPAARSEFLTLMGLQ